jgi:hypothetical protein
MRERFVSAISAGIARVVSSFDFGDVIFCIGLAAASYGVALISVPAAWIAGGSVLMFLSYLPNFVAQMRALRGPPRKK